MHRVENIEQKRVERLKEKAHTDDDSTFFFENSILNFTYFRQGTSSARKIQFLLYFNVKLSS